VTNQGAPSHPWYRTSPSRNQLASSAKHQPFLGKLIHKKSRKKIQRFAEPRVYPNDISASFLGNDHCL
jgi:hypothetical protein